MTLMPLDRRAMFDPETYAGVRLPLPRASTLPPSVYSAPEWWERELAEEDLQHTHLVLFYPNFIFNLLPDHMAYHQVFPEGPEWMTVVSTKCFPTSVIAQPDFESRLGPYYEPAELFLAEDWAVCEGVQRGVRGGRGGPGRFHPQEAPCHAFANWLLDRVVGRPPGQGAHA